MSASIPPRQYASTVLHWTAIYRLQSLDGLENILDDLAHDRIVRVVAGEVRMKAPPAARSAYTDLPL
ncbi:MAG: hypothetical protein A3H29_10580 [Acidobacteria bacterium RIFCSPLOWO2_02_FULL_67_21]|nr:MAG: hypothetical protein A3H29_10580 [Acidobacteria bacterium RIFCSPLOWO2_02_FULL_67_21]